MDVGIGAYYMISIRLFQLFLYHNVIGFWFINSLKLSGEERETETETETEKKKKKKKKKKKNSIWYTSARSNLLSYLNHIILSALMSN